MDVRSRLASLFLLSLGLPLVAQTPTRAWQHPPQKWTETSTSLTETIPPGPDYWRVTHYGFIRDNGPFRYQKREGNFEAKVRIAGKYSELDHQADLMIQVDEKNWIKAGVEYVNEKQNVSAVVTRDFFD